MPVITTTLRTLWYIAIGIFGCIMHIVLWIIAAAICLPLICLLTIPFLIVVLIAAPMLAKFHDELVEPEEET